MKALQSTILIAVFLVMNSCEQTIRTEMQEDRIISDSATIYDYFLRHYQGQLLVKGSPMADSIVSIYPRIKSIESVADWMHEYDPDSISLIRQADNVVLTHYVFLKGDPFNTYPYLTGSEDTLILNRPGLDAGILLVSGVDTLKVFEAVSVGLKVCYFIPLDSVKNRKFLRYQDTTIRLN